MNHTSNKHAADTHTLLGKKHCIIVVKEAMGSSYGSLLRKEIIGMLKKLAALVCHKKMTPTKVLYFLHQGE